VAGVATGPAREVTGGPEGGSEGRAPEGTAGPSRAGGEPTFKYVREWRWTGMGGITMSIAVCEECNAVVEPARARRSRSGTHGEDFYVHPHRLAFLVLYQSNAGNRRYNIDGEPGGRTRRIFEAAADQWIYYGAGPDEVRRYVSTMLKALPRG
jgi:hypothetical protein